VEYQARYGAAVLYIRCAALLGVVLPAAAAAVVVVVVG